MRHRLTLRCSRRRDGIHETGNPLPADASRTRSRTSTKLTKAWLAPGTLTRLTDALRSGRRLPHSCSPAELLRRPRDRRPAPRLAGGLPRTRWRVAASANTGLAIDAAMERHRARTVGRSRCARLAPIRCAPSLYMSAAGGPQSRQRSCAHWSRRPHTEPLEAARSGWRREPPGECGSLRRTPVTWSGRGRSSRPVTSGSRRRGR
jgi:hypothetical protein